MKSLLCKVLHPVAGRPMVAYVLDAVKGSGVEQVVAIVGHQAEAVREALKGYPIEIVLQEPQLGTGHAVLAAGRELEGFTGHVLIVCGDVPLIQPQTLQDFMRFHEARGSRLTVMTSVVPDPHGYGRILRDPTGCVGRIVEERDASPEERTVPEINAGMYLADARLLFRLLERVEPNNSQREYYLTDIVAAAAAESIPVHGYTVDDREEVAGINTRKELAEASAIVWDGIREALMESGVTLLDPASVFVDAQAVIGPDTVVHPGVTISGSTEIGRECVIESGVYVIDSKLGDRVKVLQGSRVDRATVGDDTGIGPMAHLRPDTVIGKRARIGNFVEVKKTIFGDGSKAAHLSYLGDSSIGKDVNIGCGTITCNYDGKHKHRTVINDRCFVGSDVQFVAPVVIGEGSLIGAGSTITRDVPPGSLAVARSKQRVYRFREKSSHGGDEAAHAGGASAEGIDSDGSQS